MAEIIKPGEKVGNQEVLMLKAELEQVAKALLATNETVQSLVFVIDYLVEKLELDPEDLKQYLDKRFKEYIAKVKEELTKNKIITPSN